MLAAAAVGLSIIILAIGVFLWSGRDAEATFEPVSSLDHEFSPNHLHGIGFDTINDRLYLASHYGLFSLENDQLYQVGNERSDFMGFSMNPNDPSEMFVSGHPQEGGNMGVMRSEDAGLNFEQTFAGSADEIVDFHAMSTSAADPDWFYGWYGDWIYRSRDRGQTFERVEPDSLPSKGLCWGAPCVTAGSDAPETSFAGTEQGLMISQDGGENWEMLNDEIGPVAAVTVHPEDPDLILAYTGAHGLAVSTDAGQTWESRHGDLAASGDNYAFAIEVDPEDTDRIFVALMNNEVFETEDGGETWTRIV